MPYPTLPYPNLSLHSLIALSWDEPPPKGSCSGGAGIWDGFSGFQQCSADEGSGNVAGVFWSFCRAGWAQVPQQIVARRQHSGCSTVCLSNGSLTGTEFST